jgi:hypothetical protein
MKQIGLGAILSRLRSLGAIGGTLILETGTAPEHHDRAGKFFKELRWMASHFTGQWMSATWSEVSNMFLNRSMPVIVLGVANMTN